MTLETEKKIYLEDIYETINDEKVQNHYCDKDVEACNQQVCQLPSNNLPKLSRVQVKQKTEGLTYLELEIKRIQKFVLVGFLLIVFLQIIQMIVTSSSGYGQVRNLRRCI